MSGMTYVDGMLAAVPNANREAYKKYAETCAVIFKEYGALSLVDCWGDDVPDGVLTSFPLAVKAGSDESVVFSWVTWPSREVRDAAWQQIHKDPRMQPGALEVPYDGKRMVYGGFSVLTQS